VRTKLKTGTHFHFIRISSWLYINYRHKCGPAHQIFFCQVRTFSLEKTQFLGAYLKKSLSLRK